jgi:Glycosyltransferases involved in cell wall biogenesis
MAQPFISVIINNYNYALFVATAIESALAQTYPHREIIVVDDGSTDESRAIIQRYADRVRVIFKENGGQASAFHAGVAASRGEVICFLDSDDYWAPQLLERVAARWDDSLAMVEWRLECVDADGQSLGRTLPSRRPPEGDLRPLLLRSISYPWTPTSGNAFSRRAVGATFPLDEALWRISADLPLLLAAPFYGALAFLDETLAYYRIHGANLYQGMPPRWERVVREVRHGLARVAVIRAHARKQGMEPHPALEYSLPSLNLLRLMLQLSRHMPTDVPQVPLRRLAYYGVRAVLCHEANWDWKARWGWMRPLLVALVSPPKALELAARWVFWDAREEELHQFLQDAC